MDYHEFSIYYGILFYNFPINYKIIKSYEMTKKYFYVIMNKYFIYIVILNNIEYVLFQYNFKKKIGNNSCKILGMLYMIISIINI